jgi:protein TonB
MDFAQQQRNPAKHLPGIVFVIILHILIVYALLNGLGTKAIKLVKGSLDTKLIEEFKKPPPDAPPPPPPKFVPPPDFIPPPDVIIAAPVTSTAIQQVTQKPPPPPRQTVRTAPVIDAKRNCPKPDFPAASKRRGEFGSVIVLFLIDTNGRAIDSKVETSSGYEALDEAARSALGSCTFKPGTVDGKPEQSWARIKYTFKEER